MWGTSGLVRRLRLQLESCPRRFSLPHADTTAASGAPQGPDDAIRVIAAAVIRDGDRILVWHDHDPATGEVVAVPLAGGIEFGETGEQAIRRELTEEIGSGSKSVRYLGLLEDIFEWAGRKRHELFLIYDVELPTRLCTRRTRWK